MKIGTVPYLNCFPLIHQLPLEIYAAPPAQLPQIAAPDDIVLAPIVTAFLDPSWYLMDGIGIGSFGPVDTVKLFFKNEEATLQNIKEIYTDNESSTSVALLKVLLERYYGRELRSLSFFQDATKPYDAALLIGDKVWDASARSSMDLGEAWTNFTGLPFVFACWMTRSKATGIRLKDTLIHHATRNLENLEALVSKAPKNNCPDLLRYWKRLRYVLDGQSKEGIHLFQKNWARLENKPTLQLNWV